MRSEISEYFDFVSTVCRLIPCGVMHTVEIDSAVCCMHTTEIDSAVCCLPRRLTRRCAAHQGNWLGGVLPTTECFEICVFLTCTLRWLILQYDANCGIGIVESDLAVWCTPQRWTLLCDTPCRDWLRGMMPHCGDF